MILKFQQDSLILQGGIKNMAKKTKSFFESVAEANNALTTVKHIDTYGNSRKFFPYYEPYYVLIENEEGKVVVYYHGRNQTVYLVDEIFDSYFVHQWDFSFPEQTNVVDIIFLCKDNKWYLLEKSCLFTVGKRLSDNIFYNSATKELLLIGSNCEKISEVQELVHSVDDYGYETVIYKTKGKEHKQVCKNGIWRKPFFWKLFSKKQ